MVFAARFRVGSVGLHRASCISRCPVSGAITSPQPSGCHGPTEKLPVLIHRTHPLRPDHGATLKGAVSPVLPSSSSTHPSWRGFAAGKQEHPFKVLGVQQIAIGGLDKKALARLWVDYLGLEKINSYKSEKENVIEDILKIGHGTCAVELDLMEPYDPEKRPKVHTPALNHIGLWVHPLPECVEWLKQQGMRFTPGGIRKGGGGHDVTFIHPKGNENTPLSGEGVLIELIQATPDIIAHGRGK